MEPSYASGNDGAPDSGRKRYTAAISLTRILELWHSGFPPAATFLCVWRQPLPAWNEMTLPHVQATPRDARVQLGMEERAMHGIIYLVGLIVVVMALLSFVGVR